MYVAIKVIYGSNIRLFHGYFLFSRGPVGYCKFTNVHCMDLNEVTLKISEVEFIFLTKTECSSGRQLRHPAHLVITHCLIIDVDPAGTPLKLDAWAKFLQCSLCEETMMHHFPKPKILFLPPAYVVRREGNVLSRVCLSVTGGEYPYPIMLCNIIQNAMGQTLGEGVPISHNALQHYPEFHGADTWGGTLPGPAWGVPCQGYPPGQVRMGGGVPCQGGYPVRTTEGVLTTRRAVCLLRSHRRTFLFMQCIQFGF